MNNAAYNTGSRAALEALGFSKTAVSNEWIRQMTTSGIAGRQAAKGLEGATAKEIGRTLNPALNKASNPAERLQAVRQTANQQGVAGRPVPVEGTAAAANPPRPRQAAPAPEPSTGRNPSWMTPAGLLGGGVGLGVLMTNSNNQQDYYRPY